MLSCRVIFMTFEGLLGRVSARQIHRNPIQQCRKKFRLSLGNLDCLPNPLRFVSKWIKCLISQILVPYWGNLAADCLIHWFIPHVRWMDPVDALQICVEAKRLSAESINKIFGMHANINNSVTFQNHCFHLNKFRYMAWPFILKWNN